MAPRFAGRKLIPATHGQLEAIHRPRADAERVALILHPHPLYGGTMHNPVVFHCARALDEAGFETLRFNFRGVGDSSGAYGDGKGELEDARNALDHLLARPHPTRDVLVAGFSFGAAVGLRLGCGDARVQRLIAIGTPARAYDLGFLNQCTKPKLFVHGEHDDVAPLADLEQVLRAGAAKPFALRVVPDTGHFFDRRLDALQAEIRRFVA